MEALTQISILIGIFVAIYGIDAWRREHVGKRRIELAEDTLALFYEASDAIKHIRHPASFGFETEQVERGERETEMQFNARKKASVVFYRYNQYQELFSKIHASRYRFMAQIGKDKAKAFDDLREIINSITHAASTLARLWSQDNFHNERGSMRHRDYVAKYEAIFWEGFQDDDPINPRVAEIITQIETVCQSVIEGKVTAYGFLKRLIGRS